MACKSGFRLQGDKMFTDGKLTEDALQHSFPLFLFPPPALCARASIRTRVVTQE